MEVLRFLEEFRNPVLDSFFSFVTHFGEETIFIVLGLLFFWCINKKEGYYLLSIGFIGTVLNQFLKLFFRIPRPWVKDKNFTIVESARAEATGYSFPSGHTQSSVGVFGAIAKWEKNKVLKILYISLCILVPFSRLYLGVHTPLDVGVSVGIALVLIFGLYPIIKKGFENDKTMRIVLLVMTVLSAGLLLFVLTYKFPEDVDADNLASGMKNAYKMLGCTLGIYIGFEVDRKYINFKTDAVLWAQVVKYSLGVLILLGIKEGMRVPLNLLFNGNFIADGIRYFLIVIFATIVWPLTFKWFSRLWR